LDSIDKIKARIPALRAELDEVDTFKDIYKFSFNFYRETKEKKGIDCEVAVNLLQVLMQGRVHVDKFTAFLQNQSSYKVINADQWELFYEFSTTVQSDFRDYDPMGSWPVIIDEYVEWAKTH